jgi:hypothetical protein
MTTFPILAGFNPAVFTSESDEVLSPSDLRVGYIVCVNGRDYRFEGLNAQAIHLVTYHDPEIVGPHQPMRSVGYFWDHVHSLHVY